MRKLSRERAQRELDKRMGQARTLLEDDDKIEGFLQDVERKINRIPRHGKRLRYIPIYLSLVYNFVRKKYTAIPYKSVVALVAALLYFLSPIDVIPDWIPFLGFLDDAAVAAFCWKLVNEDVNRFLQWRENRAK